MTYYAPGKWNVICDVCGVRFKSDEVRKRWDGLIVCPKDWEPDHPQKYLRVRNDPVPVPFIRPEADLYLGDWGDQVFCYLYAQSGYADMGQANCMQAENTTYSYARCLELESQYDY